MSIDYRAAGSAKLTARAAKYLADRGVSLAYAKHANVRSLTPGETSTLFHVRHEAILLPIAEDYGYARVFDLPREKGKFRAPGGVPLRLYAPPPPPRSKLTRERVLTDASVPLFFVEGPIKALAAMEHGFPAVGFNGCCGWQKRRVPIAGLLDYALAGRNVEPVMDADYDDNHIVGFALLALGDWLAENGATVHLRELPKVAGRTTGIDDYLAKKGVGAFQKLTTHPWDSDYVDALREKLCPFADGGNADRLIYRHGDDLRCIVAKHGRWFAWDGSLWVEQSAMVAEVQELMRETVASMFAQADRERNEKRRTALRKWATKSDNARGIRDAISLAASRPSIRAEFDDFDRDPFLLGVRNGTVDLRTGKLRPAASEDLITKSAGAAFEAAATAPRWLGFLSRIAGGNAEKIAFLQRLAGYCLIGINPERKMFIPYGLGANGKSTYIETLLKLTGDYGTPTKTEILLHARRDVDGERPTPFLLALRGARLVTIAEVAEGARLAEAIVKDVTGGDTVATRGLHADPIRFNPGFKILMRANHKPVIYGDDEAIWDRVVLIPFDVRIPEAEWDHQLADALGAELPGILNWAIEGCLAWQRDSLAIPASVRAAGSAYREEMDTFARWVEEFTTVRPLNRKEKTYSLQTQLFSSYKGWCDVAGSHPIGDRRFYAKLDERGFTRKKTGGMRYCYGVRLLTSEEREKRVNEAEALIAKGGKGRGRLDGDAAVINISTARAGKNRDKT